MYSVKVSLCLVMFYVFYKLLLSCTTLHAFNRFVILALVAASLVLPFVHVTVNEPMVEGAVSIEQFVMKATAAGQGSPEFHFSAINIAVLIYIIGVAVFFVRMLLSYAGIHRIVKRAVTVVDDAGVRINVVDGDIAPFSWFRNIVISADDYRYNRRAIITHEKAHAARWHSADILLCNVLTVVQWFNPAAWLLKAELQDVHEYEADDAVLRGGIDATGYQLLLVRKAVGDRLFAIANNLSKDSLKKRITMMKTKKSSRWESMKVLVVLPVAVVAVVAFATPKMAELETNVVADTERLVSVVKESVTESAADLPHMVAGAADIATKNVGDTLRVVKIGTVDKATGKVYNVVEKMPSFPGGVQALMSYLAKNVRYPKESVDKNEQGMVVVTFTVLEDGSVNDVQVVKSVSPQLDAEAQRVVASMPKWEPGMQDGKPANVKFTLPVNFHLQGNEDKKIGDNNSNVKGANGMDGIVVVDHNNTGTGNKEVSFKHGNAPLVLIDGKEMPDIKSLESIKPDDIESITVLKDQEATSQYGEKAKNGVVMVKMKSK